MEPMQFVEIFTASLMMPPIFVGRFARWGCRTAGQPGRLHLLEIKRRKPHCRTEINNRSHPLMRV